MAMGDAGGDQMRHLRSLVELLHFDRGAPAPEILPESTGTKYARLFANAGPGYAVIYAYTPRAITVDLDLAARSMLLHGTSPPRGRGGGTANAAWYDPANGTWEQIGSVLLVGKKSFRPGVSMEPGRDVALVLTLEEE